MFADAGIGFFVYENLFGKQLWFQTMPLHKYQHPQGKEQDYGK